MTINKVLRAVNAKVATDLGSIPFPASSDTVESLGR